MSTALMRGGALAGAVYWALLAYYFGGEWSAHDILLRPFLSCVSLFVFLVIPPRILARQLWACAFALPLPTLWFSTFREEAFTGFCLLWAAPLLMQGGLVAYHRRAAVRDSVRVPGRAVQQVAVPDDASRRS